jgi:hypothetical protein
MIKAKTKPTTESNAKPLTETEKLAMAESANTKLMALVNDLSAELHKKSGQLDELRARRKRELMEAVNEAQAVFEQQQAQQVKGQLAQQAERFTALLNNLAVDIVTPAGEVGKAVFTPAAGMVTYDQIREVLQAVASADYELYASLSPYQLVMVGCFLLAYAKGEV